MSKFLTIMKYEYAQVVKKKSFLIGIILFLKILALVHRAEVAQRLVGQVVVMTLVLVVVAAGDTG